jgi:RNA polymerase sigma-70 factor (ECF subfamily)
MVEAAVAESASSSPQGTFRPALLDARALWTEFSPPLRAFLARRVPPGVEADDLLQDVFLRVVRHLGSLRANDRLEAWLFQIARNALRDALRARQRRDGRTDALDMDLPDEFGADADHAAEAELAPCLTAIVARLPEPYRSAITLTSIQGLTQAEAARSAGISLSGMKSRVQRGRAHLRDMLVRCCDIVVDARGGVADFSLRIPTSCDAERTAPSQPACSSSPCPSSSAIADASISEGRRLQV